MARWALQAAIQNVTLYPIDWVRASHSCVSGSLVDLLELAALADLAVLVSGQCLYDEVARIRRAHQKMRDEYLAQWHAENDPQLGKEPLSDDTFYRGHDWDDMKPHLWNFFQAVKSRKPVAEDAVFGNHAALACHMANESYFQKKPVYWDAATKRITA